MYLNTYLTILLVGLATIQAFPAENLEKSLEVENLEQEIADGDKDRSKKSTICVHIKEQPQLQTVSLIPQTLSFRNTPEAVSALSLQPAMPVVPSFSIESVPTPVQTLNIHSAVPTAQSFSVQTAPHSAQIQSVIENQHQGKITSQTTSPVQPEVSHTNAKVDEHPAISSETSKEEQVEVFDRIHVDEPERIVIPHMEEEIVNVAPVLPMYNKRMYMAHPRSVMMVAEAEPMLTAVKAPHCDCCGDKYVHRHYPTFRSGVMMEPYHVDHVHIV